MEARFKWVLIIFFLLVKFSFGQGARVEQYHQEDGLPNDLVKSITLGPDGFVWVATDDGVVKMEGRELIPVDIPEMFSNNFKEIRYTRKFGFIASADPGILCVKNQNQGILASYMNEGYPEISWPGFKYPKTLFESSDSSLWIADLRNVYCFNGTEITTYSFDSKNYTDHYSRSYQLFEDSRGTIYAVSQPGYILKLDKDLNQFVELPWVQQGIQVYSLLDQSDDHIFIGNENGLFEVGLSTDGLISHSKNCGINMPVSAIKAINQDMLIIGTWTSGAYKVNLKSSKPEISQIKSTEELTVNDILIDQFDQLWFATNNGVVLLRHVPYESPFETITKSYIQDINLTVDDQIYFSDGNGVYKVAVESNHLEKIFSPDKGMVLKVIKEPEGLWMSTNTGLLIFKGVDGTTKTLDFSNEGQGIYSLEKDHLGNLWFIQDRKVQSLIKISPNGQVSNLTPEEHEGTRLRFIKLTPSGQLMIGSQGKDHYLFKYNEQDDAIENISHSNLSKYDPDLSIIDLAFKGDSIIMATKSGVWIQTSDTLFHLPVGDMTNEMVTSVALDKKGRIWLTNSNGLILYDYPDYTLFNNNDGMPSKTSTYRSLYIDNKDHIWIGTISGMAKGKVVYEGVKTPTPVLTRLESSGMICEPYLNRKFIQNSLLNFRFATPIYPSRYVRYQYSLLDKENKEWHSLQKDGLILTDLMPGKYHLRVRARNSGNFNWSDPLDYKFEIYKVWYMRFWVLVTIYLMIFAVALFVIIYIRRKNESERKKLELIIEERTRVLQEKNIELITLNSEIEDAKDEAIAAIKSKDRFFSILAHDLKSPFNTLIGFSQLLVYNRDELSEESMSQLLAEMLATSENTYRLLQNLLDWARSQTGALQITPERFSIKEIVIDLVRLFDSTALQKEIQIQYDIDDQVTVFADVSIISTLLRNLISNAIKFSLRGGTVKIEAVFDSGKTVVKVTDTGVGISEKRLATLFNIDSGNSTKGTADEKGTGLGLVLCKEFVDKSNGTLTVESKTGLGSTFIVTLPS